ncbi:MAG TPA: DeoR/GlpR transcriptional regulator [Epulopiscium sp.]|nr:DeoR/GlpR transcriptional regulator [Candidatus Epulonipiscium sp.]
MLPLERRQNIIEQVSIKKCVKVVNLSKEFGVTEETIRRDLEKLEQEGTLMRTYGGAVMAKKANEELPLSVRLRENKEGKELMGQIISGLIGDGDVIMIGSGTTNLEIARKLNCDQEIMILTNSLGVLSEAVQNNKIKVICVGGTLVRKTLAFMGPTAIKTINSYYVDKVILSCKGIDMEKGLMESSELEVEIKRAVVKSGKKVILAVDHTKFNSLSMVNLFDFSDIDMVVTDVRPSKEWMKFFEKQSIECLFSV